jgi:hypothetical protein
MLLHSLKKRPTFCSCIQSNARNFGCSQPIGQRIIELLSSPPLWRIGLKYHMIQVPFRQGCQKIGAANLRKLSVRFVFRIYGFYSFLACSLNPHPLRIRLKSLLKILKSTYGIRIFLFSPSSMLPQGQVFWVFATPLNDASSFCGYKLSIVGECRSPQIFSQKTEVQVSVWIIRHQSSLRTHSINLLTRSMRELLKLKAGCLAFPIHPVEISLCMSHKKLIRGKLSLGIHVQ